MPAMRRRTRLFLDVLAVLVLLSYAWTVQHARRGSADPVWTKVVQRGVLRVGSDPGFRPFAQETGGKWSGYDVDLATEIARRLGMRIELKAVGYDALYDTLAAGEVDLLASALPLAPQQGWRARFSSPYLDAGPMLVARADSSIQHEGDLGGQRVGAVLGSEGDTLLRVLTRKDPSVAARSDFETPEAAFAALQSGGLDAAIVEAVSAIGLAERDKRFRIVRSLSFQPYVLAMPIEAYQLQKEVEQILGELRREGFFEQLNTRWFGDAMPLER